MGREDVFQGQLIMDERLDLTSEPTRARPTGEQRRERRYVGITFACCDVYARIYINRSASAYE